MKWIYNSDTSKLHLIISTIIARHTLITFVLIFQSWHLNNPVSKLLQFKNLCLSGQIKDYSFLVFLLSHCHCLWYLQTWSPLLSLYIKLINRLIKISRHQLNFIIALSSVQHTASKNSSIQLTLCSFVLKSHKQEISICNFWYKSYCTLLEFTKKASATQLQV